MRYVVGYTNTPQGADALALAARLARSRGAGLDLVLVLDREERNQLVPTSPGFNLYKHQLAESWLTQAIATLPADIEARHHVVYAESFSEGLILAAEELKVRAIIVGAGGGIFGRFSVGSVANALLHSSPVPVALAPAGFAETADPNATLTRVTAAIGLRAGAQNVLNAAVNLAATAKIPLRLLSVVALDAPESAEDPEAQARAHAHAEAVQAGAREALPEGIEVTTEIVTGKRIEDAVLSVEWDPNEIVLVGSSRLARPAHLFIGSTASKMLRELPVPMSVVPRESMLSQGEQA